PIAIKPRENGSPLERNFQAFLVTKKPYFIILGMTFFLDLMSIRLAPMYKYLRNGLILLFSYVLVSVRNERHTKN
ncbi:hypothetical protein ACUIJ5_00005, partial [Bacillus toyonensis]